MRLYFKLIFLFLLSTTCFCASREEKLPTYTEKNPHVLITPKQAQFKIQLKSNPTTGFTWALKGYNPQIIVLVNHGFNPPSSTLVGAGGYEWWIFKIQPQVLNAQFKTTLQFQYVRPWQKNQPLNRVTFSVSNQATPLK